MFRDLKIWLWPTQPRAQVSVLTPMGQAADTADAFAQAAAKSGPVIAQSGHAAHACDHHSFHTFARVRPFLALDNQRRVNPAISEVVAHHIVALQLPARAGDVLLWCTFGFILYQIYSGRNTT